MKVKNAMNSDKCNEIKILIGQANQLKSKLDAINARETAPKAIDEAVVKVSQVQTILCNVFGAKLNETLQLAQEIELESGEEITYLSKTKLQTNEEAAKEESEKPENA